MKEDRYEEKGLISMVLAGAMAASLTGCGGGANTSTTAVPTNAASEKGGETQIQPTEAKKEESGEKQ